MTTMNQDSFMAGVSGSSGNPLVDAHLASQLRSAMSTETEKGAAALSNYGLVTKKGTPAYVGALVALSTALVRGDESKKPIKKGVFRETTGLTRRRLAELVSCIMSEISANTFLEKPCEKVPRVGPVGIQILIDTIKICFNLRDIRGTYGKGERRLFLWMFIELYSYIPNVMFWMLHEIPHYGSYKDLADLYEMVFVDEEGGTTPTNKTIFVGKRISRMSKLYDIKTTIVDIYSMQLDIDWVNYSSGKKDDVSLCSRWFPKEGRALYKATRRDPCGNVTSRVAKTLFPDKFREDFRKAMSLLRHRVADLNKHTDTVQIKMSSNNFRDIDFKSLPGRATTKFQKAWKGEDKKGTFVHVGKSDREDCRDNWTLHLRDLETGVVKAKGKMLHIHEIVSKMIGYNGTCAGEIVLLNTSFQSHVDDIIKFSKENGVVFADVVPMCDVSGSMMGDPMAVAIGMAILCSSKGIASPAWENIVIPFSSNPLLIKLQYPSTAHEWAASVARAGGWTVAKPGEGESIYKTTALGNTFDINHAGRELTPFEKVQVILRMDWGMSTNFTAALDLLAGRANEAGVKMPNCLVVSDMQFDAANRSIQNCAGSGGPLSGFDETVIMSDGWTIRKKPTAWDPSAVEFVHRDGVRTSDRMPSDPSKPLIKKINDILKSSPCGPCDKVIFWNASSSHAHPCGADDPGLVQVAGFSSNMIKLFFQTGTLDTKTDPVGTSWDALRIILDCGDYDRIGDIYTTVDAMTNSHSSTQSAIRAGDHSQHDMELMVMVNRLPKMWNNYRRRMSASPPVPPVPMPRANLANNAPSSKFAGGVGDVISSTYAYSDEGVTGGINTSNPRCVIHGKPITSTGCTTCIRGAALPSTYPPASLVAPDLRGCLSPADHSGGGAGRIDYDPDTVDKSFGNSITERLAALEYSIYGVGGVSSEPLLIRISSLESTIGATKGAFSVNERVIFLESLVNGD